MLRDKREQKAGEMRKNSDDGWDKERSREDKECIEESKLREKHGVGTFEIIGERSKDKEKKGGV